MSKKSDILRAQEYLFYGMKSCALFDKFNVVLEREFLAQSEVEFDAIWMSPRSPDGPVGAGYLIEMPKLQIPKPNSLQRNLVLSIVAIEERNTNMTAGAGTQLSSEEMAEDALDFAFGWMMGLSSALTPEVGAILPAPDVASGPGLVCNRATISMRKEHHAIARCDQPVISDAGAGHYSLANGANTPDADIYFTLDESLPGSAGLTAVKYAGPVALASGQQINYAAWRADRLPSHIGVRKIS
jgi:hypothetical protein